MKRKVDNKEFEKSQALRIGIRKLVSLASLASWDKLLLLLIRLIYFEAVESESFLELLINDLDQKRAEK